jgi:hypothetical protein
MTPLLTRLARMNRTTVFLLALVVILAGLFLPGFWGGLLLLAVVLGLASLLTRTWPVTPRPLRIVRAILVAALLIVAAVKIT